MAADAVYSAVPACKARRLVADLDQLDEWRDFVEQGSKCKEVQLYCAFGVTPNTDAHWLVRWLARESAAGDHLLISANLYDPDDPEHSLPAILPQYDNPETRRWLTTFFTDLDLPVTPDQLEFNLHEQESPARISATLRSRETHAVTIGAEMLEVPSGACFEVFFSNRFRSANLAAMLEDHGFGYTHVTETANAVEAVWHAQRI